MERGPAKIGGKYVGVDSLVGGGIFNLKMTFQKAITHRHTYKHSALCN